VKNGGGEKLSEKGSSRTQENSHFNNGPKKGWGQCERLKKNATRSSTLLRTIPKLREKGSGSRRNGIMGVGLQAEFWGFGP